MIKIGYISPTDPYSDKNSWSGTYYSTREALEKTGNIVEWIKYEDESFFIKVVRKFYKLFYGKNGSFTHTRISGWLKAKSIRQNLDDYDVIFVPGQVDIVANLKTNKPIIYYTDGVVSLMIGYYWFGFSNRAIKEAKKVESLATNNASVNIFASDWARNAAVRDYSLNEDKTFVMPFGANISSNELENIGNKKNNSNKLNVVFSGVDWKRKGGQIAVDAIKAIRKKGYDVELTICGIKDLDNKIQNLPFVNYLGFLDKEKENQYKKYINTWKEADLLILPTRAECAGIVFNEASGFGVPTLTTDTGGISNYVKNGVNGYRLPLSATGEEFADKLEEIIQNDELPSLSANAKKVYEESNSWDAWGKKINVLMDEIVN